MTPTHPTAWDRIALVVDVARAAMVARDAEVADGIVIVGVARAETTRAAEIARDDLRAACDRLHAFDNPPQQAKP